MKQVDYMIVGQGLAGSAVAVQLLKRNRSVLVIDQPLANRSSRIAAGLFNPVTGRKLTKTWLADTLFPYLHTFYPSVEERAGGRFFFPMPLYRPFLSVEEQNEWMGRSADPAYGAYIEGIYTQAWRPGVKDPFGGLLLRQCGYIDTVAYMAAVRQWIEKEGIFLDEHFDEGDLAATPEGIRYKDFEARHAIFCQGVHRSEAFQGLPVRPLKGETLNIKSAFEDTVIVNRGVYLVPAGEKGAWRVGSTYRAHDQAPAPTPEARGELEEKLSELIDFNYTCTGQDWGLRPTTPDRRPLLGPHPYMPGVVIFNGLGTKGVSLAPYFSEVLIRWIENKTPLNKDVHLERYKSVYWTSPK